MRLYFSRYIKVDCTDGQPRFILKNPGTAFSLIAPNWEVRTKSMVKFFDKAQAELDIGLRNQAKSIVDNLTNNYATLQAHYQAAYLAFASNPCNMESEKAYHEANSYIMKKEFVLRKLEVETRTLSQLEKDARLYEKRLSTAKPKTILSKSPKQAEKLKKLEEAKSLVSQKMIELEDLVSELEN